LAAATVAASPPATPLGDVWHVGPSPAVHALCHTGNLLWVGTTAGLYLIDIRNGKIVTHEVAGERLPSTSVRAIVAKGDSVFVGTDAGLSLFRRNDDGNISARVFVPAAPGPLKKVPLSRIAGLGVGANGDVLLATSGRGAGVITRGRGYAITRRDSLLDDKVFAVADRADGTRYFATSMGLCAQVRDTVFVSFQAGAGIPRGEVRALAPADRKTFYLLVANHGVFRFDGAHAAEVKSPPDVRLRDAIAISAGSDGTLWAVGDGWIYARRGTKWSRVTPPDEDRNARWTIVIADGAGAFVGSSDGRVLALNRGGALRVVLPAGLPAARVESIAADGSGAAWFVCDGRLVHADATARQFGTDDVPSDVRAIALSPDGEVWTAGRWSVRRRAAEGWVDTHPDVVEPDPSFTALVVDGAGVWVGTAAGALYHYDGGVWLRMARASGSRVDEIRAAEESAWSLRQGRLYRSEDGRWRHYAGVDSAAAVVDVARSPAGTWVAATETKLYAFDESKRAWTPAREWSTSGPDALRGRMRALSFDAEGRLIVGTTEGVALWSAKNVRWLTAGDGIGGGHVADLAVDGDRLWIGFAEDGVSVISLRGLW
jgi:ligand-binding sensor domain-containing protein